MEKPCEVCRTKTEYRERGKKERVLCSQICQLQARLHLSGLSGGDVGGEGGGGIPSFMDDNKDLWETLKELMARSLVEDSEEVQTTLKNYFHGRLVELITLLEYLHNILQFRKRENDLDAVDSEIEIAQNSFNSDDHSLSFDNISDINEMNSYFEKYKERINETRSTMVSLVEKKSQITEILRQIGERTMELALKLGRDASNESIYNSELIIEIEEVNRKKSDLLTFFSFLINTEDSSHTEEEEDDNSMEKWIEKRVEVEPGLTNEQREVFLEVEEAIKLHEDIGMKGKASSLFVKEYIIGCEIIMHIPLDLVIDKMNDTDDIYIRNLFEIGTGGGSTDQSLRARWENKIFNSEEYDAFKPHEKVKYGTVNLNRSVSGVPSLWNSYGKSYLVFTPEVKSRCTFSRNDSSAMSVTGPHDLGTTRFMANLSTKFSLEERRNMERRAGMLKPPKIDVHVLERFGDYMEVQIHGELSFKRDVAKIMIDKEIFGEGLKGSLKTLFENIGKKIPYELF